MLETKIFYLLALFLPFVFASDNTCLNLARKLAERDACLASRINNKINLGKTAKTADDFYRQMIGRSCNGTEYSCGNTMSWVSELFQGTLYQYEEYKTFDGFNGSASGYKLYYDEDLFKLFEKSRVSQNTIVYQLRHTGTEDHVWFIEQLPNQAGYRVYQSYNGAYSLKAWLSENVDEMFASGDIQVFHKVKNATNDLIKAVSGGTLDINSDLTTTPLIPTDYKPFITYVKNYGEAEAVGVFKMAWEQYGKGRIISWAEMSEYINKVQSMANYFRQYQNTIVPYSAQQHIDWLNLYGSPNPVHFPLMANNAITQYIFNPKREYRFEVKQTVIESIVPSSSCESNFKVIDSKVPTLPPLPITSGSARTSTSILIWLFTGTLYLIGLN